MLILKTFCFTFVTQNVFYAKFLNLVGHETTEPDRQAGCLLEI